MKERPLEGLIEIVSELEGGPMGYWTRGHVGKAEFAAELEAEFKVIVDPDLIEHQWCRNVPYHGPDGQAIVVYRVDGPGRGVYKATYVDIDDCDPPGGWLACWPGAGPDR